MKEQESITESLLAGGALVACLITIWVLLALVAA